MRVVAVAVLASLATAQSAPAPEAVTVPGTSVKFELVPIPGGGPAGLRPFWMGRHEVTWGEFDRFYNFPEERKVDGVTRPSIGKTFLGQAGIPDGFLNPGRPVTNLKWHSPIAYCEWLSRKTGHAFRLPTETEWEHACGPAPADLDDRAWHEGNSGGRTHVGGEKKPNSYGLCDMLGNVWECCLEPDAPPDYGPVYRGGSWKSPASELKPGTRRNVPYFWIGSDPNTPRSLWWLQAEFSQGFRVVRVADAADRSEREAAAGKIEVKIARTEERTVRTGSGEKIDVQFFVRVSGEIRNAGDRTIEELELTVYALDPQGQPHFRDLTGLVGRASFSKCYPVLPNSAHPGPHRDPLGPGGVRAFVLDVPQSLDGPEEVQADKFGAQPRVLRLAPAR